MSTTAEILKTWLDNSNADIIVNYDRDNMRASGSFAKGLRTEIKETPSLVTGTLFGAHHSLFVDQGRNKGKRPPISAIKKWIEDRRINPTDISVDSLAFLIARKIGREGWQPKNMPPNGVISSVINQQSIDKLLLSLRKSTVDNVKSEIWQQFA